jgi:hypothetical protein
VRIEGQGSAPNLALRVNEWSLYISRRDIKYRNRTLGAMEISRLAAWQAAAFGTFFGW